MTSKYHTTLQLAQGTGIAARAAAAGITPPNAADFDLFSQANLLRVYEVNELAGSTVADDFNDTRGQLIGAGWGSKGVMFSSGGHRLDTGVPVRNAMSVTMLAKITGTGPLFGPGKYTGTGGATSSGLQAGMNTASGNDSFQVSYFNASGQNLKFVNSAGAGVMIGKWRIYQFGIDAAGTWSVTVDGVGASGGTSAAPVVTYNDADVTTYPNLFFGSFPGAFYAPMELAWAQIYSTPLSALERGKLITFLRDVVAPDKGITLGAA